MSAVVLTAVGLGCGSDERRDAVAAESSRGEGQIAIARVVTGNPPREDLVLVADDGRLVRELVGGDAFSGFEGVTWSPDGRRFAFAASAGEPSFEGDEPTDIYVADLGGSTPRRLTDSGRAYAPVWSPDGGIIVYAERSPGPLFPVTATLWSIAPDGSEKRQLLEPERDRADFPTSFSPDGSELVFTRTTWVEPDPDGRLSNTATVQLLDLETLEAREIADRAAGGAFSPDGRLIAYASDRDENGELAYGDFVRYANELYVLDLATGKTTRLTKTRDLNELSPFWSPDGEFVAYEQGEVIGNAEGSIVMTVRADGTCARRLAHSPGLDVWYGSPVWRPVSGSRGDDQTCPPDAEPQAVPLAGNMTLAEARRFREFPLFWLGPRFGEFRLSSITNMPTEGARGRGGAVYFFYGEVEVQLQHVCTGLPVDIDLPPQRRLEARGLEVFLYEAGTHAEFVTGATAVTVFADRRRQLLAAIEALRPIHETAAPEGRDLPAPVEGAATGELQC